MKHFLVVILAFAAQMAFAKPPCPPAEEIHGNLDCEVAPAARPTAAELEIKGKEFISSIVWGFKYRSQDLRYLNEAQAQSFHSISSYMDEKTMSSAARIVGVYNVQKNGQDLTFGVLFDEAGNALGLQGLLPDAKQECVPYYFYEPGQYKLSYFAESNLNESQLLLLEARVKIGFSKALQANSLAGGEWTSSSLQPNQDTNEPQQSISIENGALFQEMQVTKIAELVKVKGAKSISTHIKRSGNPNEGAVCEQIK